MRRAALCRVLRLVDLVADWLIPEVLTNQRQSLQETKQEAVQQGAKQGRTVHLWKVPYVSGIQGMSSFANLTTYCRKFIYGKK